jgi:hypothetical protein
MDLPIRNAWIASACVVLAACGGDAAAAGPTVRDSAGIQIVQNTAPAWGEEDGWRIGAEPLMDLGVAEGDPRYQFAQVSDALCLSDGSVVVAEAQAQEIRVFNAAGRWVRTMGRKGGGPGEFQGLWSVFLLLGDTVAAYDYQSPRLTLFAPDGTLGRSVSLQPLEGGLPPRPLAIFADGSMLVAPMFNPNFDQNEKPHRDTMVFARYSAAGVLDSLIGRMPGEEGYSMISTGETRIAMRRPVPFGQNTFIAASGERMLIGDNARYELAEYGADGKVTRLIRRDVPREPVTDADRAHYLEANRAPGEARHRQAHERMLAAVTFPAHKSWFRGVRLDPQGNAWVERHGAPGGDIPWDVFDADGHLLGTVAMPQGLEVMEIGEDFVVGQWKDEMDVPHVRVHRIEKTPGR